MVVIRELLQVILEIFHAADLFFSTHRTLLTFSGCAHSPVMTICALIATLPFVVAIFTADIRHIYQVRSEEAKYGGASDVHGLDNKAVSTLGQTRATMPHGFRARAHFGPLTGLKSQLS